ncbi:MAG: hypothetical protein KF815_03645 [Rhodospirillales bacterium]|nr:hypothetical protein [Rhodospirillales bacterium]
MTWAIFGDLHLRGIEEIFRSGSQRVMAIVGGALLDDALRRTLAERLRNDKDITNKLLKVNGALGNTGPKIDLLYQLYAFEKPIKDALCGLTEVRNYFAHNLDASFDSKAQKMVSAMKSLTLHDGKTHYPHHLYNQDSEQQIEQVRNNQDRFLVNLKLCLIALMRDRVSHFTWSNTPRSEEELREHRKRKNEARSKTAQETQ